MTIACSQNVVNWDVTQQSSEKARIVKILLLEAEITLYPSMYKNTAFPKHVGLSYCWTLKCKTPYKKTETNDNWFHSFDICKNIVNIRANNIKWDFKYRHGQLHYLLFQHCNHCIKKPTWLE